MKKSLLFAWFIIVSVSGYANSLLIPMDESQTNHLKAYGIAYRILQDGAELDWLINYRGGSFLLPDNPAFATECRIRGVSFERLSDAKTAVMLAQIARPEVNMDAVKLLKAAKIVVYSPVEVSPAEFENTDAVLRVLTYAEIPFEVVYDEEILKGELPKYDWLHLHHEDFTGQFGRNMGRMSAKDIQVQEGIAKQFGYAKVSQMKLAVAKAIKGFCAGGGYLFAMCSATETLDLALAAEGVDIVDASYDGDGIDTDAQQRLDFSKTLAFGNFTIDATGGYYGMTFSDINEASGGGRRRDDGPVSYFSLFDFSAKWDVIPTMLVQNHQSVIKEFFGQTTAFRKTAVKPNVLVMGQGKTTDRYLYGELGRGQWTFYGGHDPEGVRGQWRTPSDLNLHLHSPGYRLILNNVLFPSARKKKRKTTRNHSTHPSLFTTMEVICTNDSFPAPVLAFYAEFGVKTPQRDQLYSVRQVKRHTNGETGLLLNELQNPEVPVRHPVLGEVWFEPTFNINRFATLLGQPVKQEEMEDVTV